MSADKPMTHTIVRISRSTLRDAETLSLHNCRLTPKRIMLENGEVYDRARGTRILPLDWQITSLYKQRVDSLQLLADEKQFKEAWKNMRRAGLRKLTT